MTMLSSFRQRLSAIPVDPVPLRRAGVLAVLLVVLVVGSKMLSPARERSAAEPLARQAVQAETEGLAALRAARTADAPLQGAVAPTKTERSGITGGRILAVLLLLGGGALAWFLRRRGGTVSAHETSLEVLETQTLGPGQSLRLVACGADVLLLGVGSEGPRLIQTWARDDFEASGVSLSAPEASEPEAEQPEATPEGDSVPREFVSFASVLAQVAPEAVAEAARAEEDARSASSIVSPDDGLEVAATPEVTPEAQDAAGAKAHPPHRHTDGASLNRLGFRSAAAPLPQFTTPLEQFAAPLADLTPPPAHSPAPLAPTASVTPEAPVAIPQFAPPMASGALEARSALAHA